MEKDKKNAMTAAGILAFTLLVCIALIVVFRKPGKPDGESSLWESIAESLFGESDEGSSEEESQEDSSESPVGELFESLAESLFVTPEESHGTSGQSTGAVHNLTAANLKKKLAAVKEKKPASSKSAYHAYWELWCQGAAGNATFRSGGCRVIAQAKMLVEMGLLDPAKDDPDSYLAWARKKGYFMTGRSIDEYFKPDVNTGVTLETGAAAIAWADKAGVTVRQYHKSLSGKNTAEEAKMILGLLAEGYYIIVAGDCHQCYVARELSLGAGKTYVLDSYSDCSYSPLQVKLYEGDKMVQNTDLYYYQIVK